MENSSLLQECRLIYRSIQLEINQGAVQLTELKWIEWAFGISVHAWAGIEKLINQYRFLNQQDEIEFYKTLKPQFAGLIDHFPLLYKSVLFTPSAITDRSAYWESEQQHNNELILRVISGCRFYEEQPNADRFFLKQNNQQPLDFDLNISGINNTSVSYSYLLGKLEALKKFRKFLQARVGKHVPAETPLVA